MIEQAERAALANVFPVGAITKSSDGHELAEMGEMKAAGAVAVSDDGRPVPNAGMMRRAMQYAKDFDLPVVDHCEDKSLSSGGVMPARDACDHDISRHCSPIATTTTMVATNTR